MKVLSIALFTLLASTVAAQSQIAETTQERVARLRTELATRQRTEYDNYIVQLADGRDTCIAQPKLRSVKVGKKTVRCKSIQQVLDAALSPRQTAPRPQVDQAALDRLGQQNQAAMQRTVDQAMRASEEANRRATEAQQKIR